jgi:hypothetical protein
MASGSRVARSLFITSPSGLARLVRTLGTVTTTDEQSPTPNPLSQVFTTIGNEQLAPSRVHTGCLRYLMHSPSGDLARPGSRSLQVFEFLYNRCLSVILSVVAHGRLRAN